MKDTPLISVIVPIFNSEKYIEECIESIINQTYKNLEIILVDDGSTDGSPQICDDFAKKEDRIKVIHKKNGGPSSARNAGIDAANGEYLGFVDSDDFIANDLYETLLNGFKIHQEGKIGIVNSRICQYIDGKIETFAPQWEFETLTVISPNDYSERVLRDTISIVFPTKLYVSSLMKSVRLWDGLKNEDSLYHYQLSYEIEKGGWSIVELPYCGYYYRFNPNGIKFNKVNPLDLYTIRNDAFYVEDTRANCPKYYNLACGRFIRDFVYFYTIFYDNQKWRQYLGKISEYKSCISDFYFDLGPNVGIRHKLMYLIVWHFPWLWRFEFIRLLCTHRGSFIPW